MEAVAFGGVFFFCLHLDSKKRSMLKFCSGKHFIENFFFSVFDFGLYCEGMNVQLLHDADDIMYFFMFVHLCLFFQLSDSPDGKNLRKLLLV